MDTPVVQPVPPPPKNNSGILIGLLLFLLGVLVGLALGKTGLISGLRIPYLSAMPTPLPKPTGVPQAATCTTCADTKYNISFEVPDGYTGLIHPQDWGGDYVILKKYSEPQRINSWIQLSILPRPPGIVQTYKDITFRNLGESILYYEHLISMRIGEAQTIKLNGTVMDAYNQYTRLEDTTIGGKPAKVFINKKVWEGGPDVVNKLYFIDRKFTDLNYVDYVYAINAMVFPASNTKEINLTTLDQILSTFTFTR